MCNLTPEVYCANTDRHFSELGETLQLAIHYLEVKIFYSDVLKFKAIY